MKRVKKLSLCTILLLALSLCLLFAFVACDSGEEVLPEVTNVTLVAAEGETQGRAGDRHILSYTAPEGSDISVSVQKGTAVATADDYVYTKDNKSFVFYVPGTYTVTVRAALNGLVGSGKAEITIQASSGVSVRNVQVNAAAGATAGKTGEAHFISYQASGNCVIDVSVQREGEPAPADAYTYTKATGKIVFHKSGNYTITVTGSNGDDRDSSSKQIEIAAHEAPVIAFSVSRTAAKEEDRITLTATVEYESGDIPENEELLVEYKPSSAAQYEKASSDMYDVDGNTFIPHVAGRYRLAYSAQGACGSSGVSDTKEISVVTSEQTLELTRGCGVQDMNRIAVGVETELPVTVNGPIARYIVSCSSSSPSIKATPGANSTIKLTASAVDAADITINYRHRANSIVNATIVYHVYSVSDMTYSPVFGADPFGGMPSTVLTSMGHEFGLDVAPAPNTGNRTLSLANATFKVSDNETGVKIAVYHAADDPEHPYVIAEDFDDNTHTGTFSVKMTVTDPVTGAYVCAIKNFTLEATVGPDIKVGPSTVVHEFVKAHPEYFTSSTMGFAQACDDVRHNMVLTKHGAIIQRKNPTWPLKQNNSEIADVARMDCSTASANCKLNFKMTVLGTNSGKVWLAIGLRTVEWNGWCGFINIQYTTEGYFVGSCSLTGVTPANVEGAAEEVSRIPATAGTVMYFSLDRRVVGDNAIYTLLVKTTEEGEYAQFMRITVPKSDAAGNVGAPISLYQFSHCYGGGCYLLENVSISEY